MDFRKNWSGPLGSPQKLGTVSAAEAPIELWCKGCGRGHCEAFASGPLLEAIIPTVCLAASLCTTLDSLKTPTRSIEASYAKARNKTTEMHALFLPLGPLRVGGLQDKIRL